MHPPTTTSVVGDTPCRYRALAAWHQLPAGYRWSEVAGVAVAASDLVYVFSRDEHRVLVFSADGEFLHAWGEGKFVRPHGISIGPDGAVYCTDDLDHTIRKFTPE